MLLEINEIVKFASEVISFNSKKMLRFTTIMLFSV